MCQEREIVLELAATHNHFSNQKNSIQIEEDKEMRSSKMNTITKHISNNVLEIKLFIILSSLIALSIHNSSFNYDVYSAPPEHGKYSDCDETYNEKTKIKTRKCCWREPVPGQILAKTYCQTCTNKAGSGWNCQDKVLQNIANVPLSNGIIERAESLHLFEQNPTNSTNGEMPGQQPTDGGLESLLSNEAEIKNPTIQNQQEQQPLASQGLESVLPSDTQNHQEIQSQANEEAALIEQPITCPLGSVFNSDINECLLENPPQLCFDGSLSQSSGIDGVTPTCPPFELEQLETEGEITSEFNGDDNIENTDEQETTVEGLEQPSSNSQISNSTN